MRDKSHFGLRPEFMTGVLPKQTQSFRQEAAKVVAYFLNKTFELLVMSNRFTLRHEGAHFEARTL